MSEPGVSVKERGRDAMSDARTIGAAGAGTVASAMLVSRALADTTKDSMGTPV
jgi:hypothetical protein